jgi:hypothetical protein
VRPSPPQRATEDWRIYGRSAIVGLLFFATSLLAACSGIKPYENSLHKNLRVHTKTDSGSWFSRIHAAVDIHRVGETCTVEYVGTVQLTEATTEIGIPPDRWSQLVFVFAHSSFLANRSGTITYETVVRPRLNYHYEAVVSYKNDIYHVVIRELPPNRSAGRELDPSALRTCGSPSALK